MKAIRVLTIAAAVACVSGAALAGPSGAEIVERTRTKASALSSKADVKVSRLFQKTEGRAARLATAGADPARIVALREAASAQARKIIDDTAHKIDRLETTAGAKLARLESSDDLIAELNDSMTEVEDGMRSHHEVEFDEFESHMHEHEMEAESHQEDDDGPGHDAGDDNGGGNDDGPGHT